MFVFPDIFHTEYTPLCPGGDGMLKNFIRSRLHFLSNEEMHLVVLTKDNTTYQKKTKKTGIKPSFHRIRHESLFGDNEKRIFQVKT